MNNSHLNVLFILK